MAITPGGPYNIPNDMADGDPGQLEWAADVADSVNDMDLNRVLKIYATLADVDAVVARESGVYRSANVATDFPALGSLGSTFDPLGADVYIDTFITDDYNAGPFPPGGEGLAQQVLRVVTGYDRVPWSASRSRFFISGAWQVTWGDWEIFQPADRNAYMDVAFVGATAYTPTVRDQGKLMRLFSTSAPITVTLPNATTADFPGGGWIDFIRVEDGGVTFVAESGATVVGTPSLEIRARNSVVRATLTGSNAWVVTGDLADPADVPPGKYVGTNTQTGTTYTPVLSDRGKLIFLNNSGAITLTLPNDSTAAFALGDFMDFLVIGAGMATFVGGGGATVNGTPSLVTRASYSAVTAIKTGADAWVVVGDLAS